MEKNKYIYISSHYGIFVFDKTIRGFNHPLNKIFSGLFKDQMCWQQVADFHDTGYTFVCTQASGLYRVSYQGNNKTKLLPGVDEIFQCYSGPVGNLATSTHSMYFFEGDGQNYIRFAPGVYPLPGDLAFNGFCAVGKDQLCVTGNNGFTIIHLKGLKEYVKNLSPAFFIQDVEVLNHLTYRYPEPSDVINLKHDENNIKITLNTDWIGSVSDMNIRYLFKGATDTFRLLNTNEISFSNVAPGEYDLQIFTQASNGIWNKNPLSLVIHISSPWYASSPARIAYAGFTLLFIWSIFQFYKGQEERKRKYQLIRLESELKSLRSQMNPHFMFNALNAIQQYMINNDKENANIYLSDFARLVRQTLDNTGKETLPLKEEIDWLTNYLNLENLRYTGKFDFVIELGENVPEECEIPTMMIQPFVENAIKHGLFHKEDKGRVTLKFSYYTDKLLRCVIEDNGIGIRAAREKQDLSGHESKGSTITVQRMMYINQKYKTKGSIEIIDLLSSKHSETGTRVIVLLPYFSKDVIVS